MADQALEHLTHPKLPQASQSDYWTGLPGSALALAIQAASASHKGPVLVIAADAQHAHALASDLRLLAHDDTPVLHFPDWDTLPYDRFSPNPELISQRLETLACLPNLKRAIVVAPVAATLQRLAPKSYIGGSAIATAVGETLSIDDFRERLEAASYHCVDQVFEPGEFSVRGAVLDLFPMGAAQPYRIELFDEEIDSIRSFDPESQRSVEKIERLDLMPAREFAFDDEGARRFRRAFRDRFDVDTRKVTLYQDARKGVIAPGMEYYLPLFFEQTEDLYSYLPKNTLIIQDQGAEAAGEAFLSQAGERFEQRAHDPERPILAPQELYLPMPDWQKANRAHARVLIDVDGHRPDVHAFDGQLPPDLPIHARQGEPAEALRSYLEDSDERVLIAVDSRGRREALLESLRSWKIKPRTVDSWSAFYRSQEKLAITVAPLATGFRIEDPALCVITESQLYPDRAQHRRSRPKAARDPESIIRDLTDLHIGAPVVHEDHGVGRYQGLQVLDVGEDRAEFIALEYANEDRLYVPVADLDLVSRYTGTSPEQAPLHKLGGEQWTKAKRKAAEKVRDVAAELLEIYAQREAANRRGIKIDRPLYEQFSAEFPFDETEDQQNAIESVLADLAGERHMDRVVCGDVGFGKTEVALRAAFAVASAGRQVAVLVPTTLLAQQHFENFSDRLADWPFKVAVLSRFRSSKQVNQTLDELREGKVDIIIGTHKLIQGDVGFKDLGLVIIDEEQRFGVRQKERFKALRAEVDLLTLTATPIPRTLNMAMSGLRDLSIIATPPAHRLSVKTFVAQWDAGMIGEACQRELQRGGQVFFLHNEVRTIEKMARDIEEILPQARVRLAHGQMAERELEQVMLDFYRQRFNILVSTTIIESGIDIPNANTILINRADKFGLAQLHQLRGRVGRSHMRAYAYMMVPDEKAMTRDARKRLDALASLDELGAGFTLATHDLEIRGAGELLGDEQSGQIQEVGFTLYTELLERAVESLRRGETPSLEDSRSGQAEVNLHMPALIPDDYLPDVHLRLSFYKRIASARTPEALRELQIEMIDRFGLMPDALKHLFTVSRFKQQATALGIEKFEFGPLGGRLVFGDKPRFDPMRLIELVQSDTVAYQLEGQHKLRVRAELEDREHRIDYAEALLQRFGAPEKAA
jgi:transcription-repair coupling factor (superfamily II helicase)